MARAKAQPAGRTGLQVVSPAMPGRLAAEVEAPVLSAEAAGVAGGVAGSGAVDEQMPVVLGRLRQAARGVLVALGDVRNPADLSRRLGLDRSLGWKMWRLSVGAEAVPDAKFIPGRAALDRFCRAARTAGAAPEAVAELRQRFDDFAALAKAHARDRPTIDMLINALGSDGEGTAAISLATRRALFRANAEVLGVQARALVQVAVIHPTMSGGGASAGHHDITLARGFLGIVRTRPSRSWLLGRSSLVQAGGPVLKYVRQPLEARPDGLPLLEGFSSPAVQVRRLEVRPGTVEDELRSGPMGEAHAVDVTLAERVSDIPRDPSGREAIGLMLRMPCQWACLDLLIHRSCSDGLAPVARAYTMVNGEQPYLDPERRDEVPLGVALEPAQGAFGAGLMPLFPRRDELLRWMLARTGVSEHDLVLHRLAVKLPPVPLALSVDFGLPV